MLSSFIDTKTGKYLFKILVGRDEEFLFRKAMSDPFKNIIFTFLSQNTSSENTRRAYLGLIRRFEVTPQCLAEANEKEISEAIRPGGLHRVKAKRIKEIADYVLSLYGWTFLDVGEAHMCSAET